MANFKYKAYSPDGEYMQGVVEAPNQLEAIAKVKQLCPVVDEITEVRLRQERVRKKQLSPKELSLMCSRFTIILRVGLPIVQAVDMVASQMDDRNISLMLREVAKDVAVGRSLSSAFAAREGFFPVTFLETVRSGEESGDLTMAFERLTKFYDKATKNRQKLTSALIYPVFVLVVAVVVVAVIMIFAVPNFTSSFSGMGIELPLPTRIVIGFSNLVTSYGVLIAFVIVLIIFGCRLYARTERGAALFASMALSIPLAGKMIKLSCVSQYAHTMSMMLTAGMPILQSLDTAGRGVSNYIIRRDILAAASGIEAGKSLGGCLTQSRYLPSLLVEMIKMGEATGSLEQTLQTVGEYYDNEVEVATSRMLAMIEPIMIVGLSGVVVLILLAVYLPMFSMYGNI